MTNLRILNFYRYLCSDLLLNWDYQAINSDLKWAATSGPFFILSFEKQHFFPPLNSAINLFFLLAPHAMLLHFYTDLFSLREALHNFYIMLS